MLCVICRKGKAEAPDRNYYPSRKKRVCRKCHAQRLLDDLKIILDRHERLKDTYNHAKT